MADRLYPTSLQELELWRRQHGTTADEARKRFAQFAILECIATAPACRQALAFKGGNALRFIYGNRRSTIDLDFSTIAAFPDNPSEIRAMLDGALEVGGRRLGVKAKCQRVKRNPSDPIKTQPTYSIKAAYQFPGDRYFNNAPAKWPSLSAVIDLEITLNDLVCLTQDVALSTDLNVTLKVCVLDDILAEKLRALLQQPLRKRNRRQDVFDIARMVRDLGNQIDTQKLGDYLIRKALARNIEVRRSSFNADVRARAAIGYEHLFSALDPAFIPFDEAWNEVQALVAKLEIPD